MERKLVSFDWAIKKILRDKENFCILEGFLSELLFTDITILEILDSESNQERENDKYNRVDIKVRNTANELMIVEVQYSREDDFLHRLLYSVSKTITEHMSSGMEYSSIKKVISISILYFDLGVGDDYIYRGGSQFEGIHNHSILELDNHQKLIYGIQEVRDIFPEYYLINLRKFHDETKDTLDEWVYFLKNGEVKSNFKARGLKEANERLEVLRMNDSDRKAFAKYQEQLHDEASFFQSTYIRGAMEGRAEGREEGIELGREEGIELGRLEEKRTTARLGKSEGIPVSVLAKMTGLSEDEIAKL